MVPSTSTSAMTAISENDRVRIRQPAPFIKEVPAFSYKAVQPITRPHSPQPKTFNTGDHGQPPQ